MASNQTPSAQLPPPAQAHTSKLVTTPPSLKDKKEQRKALSFILGQLREIPQVDNVMQCPMIEYIGSLALNHLPPSAPVEHAVEVILQVYQTLYPGSHDPTLVKHLAEYLIQKGVIGRAPLLKQAGHAFASFAKHALA
jgi:hypothetical protein